MTRYSFEFSQTPCQVIHLDCGALFDVYSTEWPPKVVVCTNCHVVLELVGHNTATGRLAYRNTK